MFVRITSDPAPRPTSLGELGIASESNPRVSLNEFTYKKGGLTLETVSRALSRLHDLDIIGFIGSNQRQIVLLNRLQLASLDLQN